MADFVVFVWPVSDWRVSGRPALVADSAPSFGKLPLPKRRLSLSQFFRETALFWGSGVSCAAAVCAAAATAKKAAARPTADSRAHRKSPDRPKLPIETLFYCPCPEGNIGKTLKQPACAML